MKFLYPIKKLNIKPWIKFWLLKKANHELPKEYQEVEYIQSSGTQYIDTGFKPNQDTRVVTDILIDNTQLNWVYGARTTVNVNTFSFLVYGRFRTDYNTTQGNIQILLDRCVIDKNKNITTTYKNGVQQEQNAQNYATFTPNVNMFLFTVNDNGTASGSGAKLKLYSCQIYDNGTLVRSYIPCYRKSDDVIGLYDVVNNEFYTNAGSGTFEKGSDV